MHAIMLYLQKQLKTMHSFPLTSKLYATLCCSHIKVSPKGLCDFKTLNVIFILVPDKTHI